MSLSIRLSESATPDSCTWLVTVIVLLTDNKQRQLPKGGASEVSTVRVRRTGERSGRKGGSINVRRLDNSDYVRERRVRRWFGEAIITCYRTTLLQSRKIQLSAAGHCRITSNTTLRFALS
jgi:hypothetical protein